MENDDGIQHPWKSAFLNAGKVLLAFTPGAVCMLLRYRNLLHGMSVWAASIPIGILAVCFADAGLRRLVGTKVADNILKFVLAAGLVLGVFLLTRYMDDL